MTTDAGPAEATPEDWFDANRQMWDERVPIHVDSDFYGVADFKAGRQTLEPFEIEEMGPVRDRELVHLQCHFGLDTLSWARLGARVTGLDFSQPAVEAAKGLARECGIDARFVAANVYDALEVLDHLYDIVYVNLGALNWLPDVWRWAEIVAALLRPGGRLYLREAHPFADVFADEQLDVEYDYFADAEPLTWEDAGTYADPDAPTVHNRSFEWQHPISEVVSAVLAQGLHLDLLHEQPYTVFQRWPFLERHEDGTYWMPEDRPLLPLMYTLKATKVG
ncbi:MAG: methyltransferase domain-containing protein [Acidimicrobiales bacterium]|nr:methyltransferase domain-containing protein [Acidimicrobiales bacterium]